MGHQENMEPWYGAKKCQPGLVAHWFSIGQWMKHGTWNWGLLWKWFAGPMNHPLRVDLIGDSDRKWQNRIDICKYSNCKNRYSGASKRDRKETSTKTDDKVLSHASPSIFCSTFHHFLSPFPLAKGVPWTVAWLISWWWIGTSWRGKSSKALSPVWCGFDVENDRKWGKWWGKHRKTRTMPLCCTNMYKHDWNGTEMSIDCANTLNERKSFRRL